MRGSRLSTWMVLALTLLCLLNPSTAFPSEWKGFFKFGADSPDSLEETEAPTAAPNPYRSQECKQETKVIQHYHNLQEELRMCLTEGMEGQLDDCQFTSENSTEFNCNILYKGTNKSRNAYDEMCDRAHGHIIHRTLDLVHNYLGLFTFNVTMVEIPQCVGLSCTQEEVGPEDLENPIFTAFIEAYAQHDLCAGAHRPMGELGFWGSLGVKIASWSGVDLAECFKDTAQGEEGDEERYLRGLPMDPLDLEGIDVFDGEEGSQSSG